MFPLSSCRNSSWLGCGKGFDLDVAVEEDPHSNRIGSETCEGAVLMLAMVRCMVRTLICEGK